MRTDFALSSGTIAALDNSDALAPGPRPAVLLVPGYTGSKEDFLPLLRPLAEAGYRAVAIDQRGQFESEWASDPAGYTIEALAADVCQLATELAPDGSRLHLVGHSLGGLVGRAAVLAKSELFDSFTLMSSGPDAVVGQRRTLLDAGELVLASRGMAGLWNYLEAGARADPRYARSSPALLAFLRTRFMATDPVGLRVMGDELRTAEDRTAELAGTGLPMLVLHGVADDAWLPAVQAGMARRLGAAHVVIAASAHSPAVENPAATVRALLDFWRRLP
ncbi:MAG TPA: alpha/beta hydrolase [Jatrophihabitans sp.]|nr:alpha/beta hydrolase [Jatrophihabitans sp.]